MATSKERSALPENLAVQGVFFKCPELGPEVLTKEQWQAKMRDVLYKRLPKEKGPTSCLIIRNLNSNQKDVEGCIKTLNRYIENLLNYPKEQKYQRIRLRNEVYTTKVKTVAGAEDFLRAAGFDEQLIPFQGSLEKFLVFNSKRADQNHLRNMLEALNDARPIQLHLDRNTQVLIVQEASQRTEFPNDFYDLTPSELRKEQSRKTQTVQGLQELMTKKVREKLGSQNKRKYNFAVIRVRFPGNFILQGTFGAQETLGGVRAFVQENLAEAGSFTLSQGLSKPYSDNEYDSTLQELNLVPATLLNFAWGKGQNKTYLKPSLISKYRRSWSKGSPPS